MVDALTSCEKGREVAPLFRTATLQTGFMNTIRFIGVLGSCFSAGSVPGEQSHPTARSAAPVGTEAAGSAATNLAPIGSKHGRGFDMTYIHKLFGAFERLHTLGQYPGMGIGLAMVRRIVRRHGGQVWIESRLDEAAVFHFTNPQHETAL